jgi:Leucine-rich repeat (LRR) protein
VRGPGVPHAGNKIAVLRNVASVGEHLLELHAAKNCITAADLRGLQKLVFLDLADNRLTSLEHVQGLSELPALTHLILHGPCRALLAIHASAACGACL